MKPTEPRIETTVRGLQDWAQAERCAGRRIALVPTMGALHPGHLSLVRIAGQRADRVVVSIFVNPTQFGPNEDLANYPRDLERDVALLRPLHVDVVFAPSVEQIYPPGDSTRVDVEGLVDGMCGRGRPGHFRGVTTVVARLLNAAQPHLAVFGEKDYQQVSVVRRMVRDLCFDTEIVSAPTVREPDGLAMSSRNAYLAPDARQQARSLNEALHEAQTRFDAGERDARVLLAAARQRLEKEPLAQIEYVELRDADTLEELDQVERCAVLGLAVRFTGARLIDNTVLGSR